MQDARARTVFGGLKKKEDFSKMGCGGRAVSLPEQYSRNRNLSCKTVFPIFSAAVGSTVITYHQCSKYPLETS